ncbi:MAG: serine/threonine protein kinase [Planctomycetota bacterium]|nr:MAG: serine/threonine protein kinase [Planctomycetota bacterium]
MRERLPPRPHPSTGIARLRAPSPRQGACEGSVGSETALILDAWKDADAETEEERLPFGELAVLEELVTRDQLRELLERQAHDYYRKERKVKIGTLLVREGYLSKKEGKRLLKIQQQAGPIEGYQLLEHLGSGGMGSVFRAIQEETGRELAVKILPPRATHDRRYRTRFLREAKLLAELDHPNLVRCYAQGESNDHLYYAMELVPGRTGRALLKREGFLYEEDLRSYLRQMLSAMDHYWAQRIVHRDIKPENIMFTPDGVVKLTDLGLSRQLDDGVHITRAGKTLGTPLYISPELAQGKSDIDIRSDLYSLGATFYHLACGVPPFYAPSQAELLKQHVEDPAPPPRMHNPDLSLGMEAILLKLLEKQPEDRFDDPRAVLDALDRLERGEHPVPPPKPVPPAPRRRLGSSGQVGALPRRRPYAGSGSSALRAGYQPSAASPPRAHGLRNLLAPLALLASFLLLFGLGVLWGSARRPGEALRPREAPSAEEVFAALLERQPREAAREALRFDRAHPDRPAQRLRRLEAAARRLPEADPLRAEVDLRLAAARTEFADRARDALSRLEDTLIERVAHGQWVEARAALRDFPRAFLDLPDVRADYEELREEFELQASAKAP